MLGVGLALIPLLLFAYLGLHNRLLMDDYVYIGLARDIGTWKAMLAWREFWNGGYSNFLLYGLLAPLDASAPPVFSLILCASAFVGFGWLTNTLLANLKIRAHRPAIVVALASLTTAAVINGFYHAQVFYWLTGAVIYNWPAVMLLLGIAMAAATAHRLRGRIQHLLAGIAAAIYAFISAGFSEMYLIFQLAAVALIAVFVFIFSASPQAQIASHSRKGGLSGDICQSACASGRARIRKQKFRDGLLWRPHLSRPRFAQTIEPNAGPDIRIFGASDQLRRLHACRVRRPVFDIVCR